MNKQKETYLLKTNSWKEIVSNVSKDCGLPEVSSSLGIYFVDGDDNYELKFINSDCYFKANNKKSFIDENF